MSEENRSHLIQTTLHKLGSMLDEISENHYWPVKVDVPEFRKILSLEISLLFAYALTGGQPSGITPQACRLFGEIYYADLLPEKQFKLAADALQGLVANLDLTEIHQAVPPYLAVFIEIDRQHTTHFARKVVSQLAAICLSAVTLEIDSSKLAWLYDYLDHLNQLLDEQGLDRLTKTKDKEAVRHSTLTNSGRTVEDCLRRLDDLVGLSQVKVDFRNWIEAIENCRIRQAQGQTVLSPRYHFVFTGASGVGKSTVAQLLGQALADLHELEQGQVVRVNASQLCGVTLEQTQQRIRELFQEAYGGVLMVEEIGQLLAERNFCQQALDILVKFSAQYQLQWVLVLIIEEDQAQNLCAKQPALAEPLFQWWHFPDFELPELVQLFDRLCREHQLRLETMAEHRLETWCDNLRLHFGASMHGVKWLFEQTKARQKERIQGLRWLTDSEEQTICAEDFPSLLTWTERK